MANRSFRIRLVAIFAFALLLRLLHLWQIHVSPLFSMRLGDSAVYDAWARGIAGGNWVGNEVFWYAPLYPYFLGSVYAVFGDGDWIVRIVQAVIGAASCVVLADATRRWFSPRAGALAGLILALYAPALFYDGLVHKPVLVLFLLSFVLWITSTAVERPLRPGPALALGGVSGLLVLARENSLVFVPVLLVWLLFASRPVRNPRIVPALAFVLGLAIALAPVALRNKVAVGEFRLTAANFGGNFYKGNNEYTDGTYVSLVPLRGNPEFERKDAVEIAEREMGRALIPAEVSRYWTGRALDYVRANPADWLKLMARKTLLVWNATELADSEDVYTHATWSPILRSTLLVFHLGLLAPLALFGLWATWDRRRSFWFVYLMLALYPASVVLFYVFGRYRYPVVALLVPFAAAGVVEAGRFLRKASRRRRMLCLATVALALIAANWPVVSRNTVRANTLYNIGVSLSRQPDRAREAIGYYEQSLDLQPRSARTLYNLGNALKRQGDLERAEARYRQALRHMPELSAARNNLASTLEARGRLEEAIEQYRRAVESDPDNWEALSNMGLILARLGRFREAEEALTVAVRIRPDEAAPHYNLGNVLFQKGDPVDAEARYRRALELEPYDARIHNNLGSALFSLGRRDEAIDCFREALRLDPQNASARTNLQAASE